MKLNKYCLTCKYKNVGCHVITKERKAKLNNKPDCYKRFSISKQERR